MEMPIMAENAKKRAAKDVIAMPRMPKSHGERVRRVFRGEPERAEAIVMRNPLSTRDWYDNKELQCQYVADAAGRDRGENIQKIIEFRYSSNAVKICVDGGFFLKYKSKSLAFSSGIIRNRLEARRGTGQPDMANRQKDG